MFIVVAILITGAIGLATRPRTGLAGGSLERLAAPSYDPSLDRAAGPYISNTANHSALSDAEADASHWVDRLSTGISALDGAGDLAATQALSDADERRVSARRRLQQATTIRQFELAAQTALEGLHHVRAARVALELDPGPALPTADPALSGGRVPSVESRRRVTVSGIEYEASPQPGDRTPYYYPGGLIRGRAVPAGWYSTPWWKTALIGGAAGVGSMLVLDALFGKVAGRHGGSGSGPIDRTVSRRPRILHAPGEPQAARTVPRR